MANYHICPVCKEPIKVENYTEHFEKHGKKEEDTDLAIIKRILDEAKESWKLKGNNNVVSLYFEIAKRVFSEVEKIDTSTYNYVFDSEYPDLMSIAKVEVPSPHPAIMCAPKFRIKDKALFEKLLRKYRGTPKEQMLKDMVSKRIPTVVVFGKELTKQFIEWKSKGMTASDITIMTVYFFLHEMYHIEGFGEKDSSVKASIAVQKIFGQRVSIPEHEIERWKFEEKQRKQESENP